MPIAGGKQSKQQLKQIALQQTSSEQLQENLRCYFDELPVQLIDKLCQQIVDYYEDNNDEQTRH